MDPVTAADGHTYDRIQITRWLSTGHRNSPVTGARMPSESVVDNVALRKIIREWAEQMHGQMMREHRLTTEGGRAGGGAQPAAASSSATTGEAEAAAEGDEESMAAPPAMKRQRTMDEESRACDAIATWLNEVVGIRRSDAEKLSRTLAVTYGCEGHADVADLVEGSGAAWESPEAYADIKLMHRIKIKRALAP